MSEDNDYLWNRSGPVDPDIQRLESLLSGYAGKSATSPLPISRKHPIALWISLPLAAAATLMIAVLGNQKGSHYPSTTWNVERLAGAPVVDSLPLVASEEVSEGGWIQTDDSSQAVISIGLIGKVQIDPNSRVLLISTKSNDNRLLLVKGTLHASVLAPPRVFSVETPSATAIDLGCAYTLSVDDRGRGRLCVTSGWVALAHQGHEAIVPTGAVCETRPGVGPGTPYFGGASEEFRLALARFDFEGANRADLETVLHESNVCELFTLWQLLPSVHDDHRGMIYDRMAQIMPPPAGVTREGVLALNGRMLEAWGAEFSREEFIPCLTSCTASVGDPCVDDRL